MNGLLLGVAMLVSSTAAAPPPEVARAPVALVTFTFGLPATVPESTGFSRERRGSASLSSTTRKRFSKMDRAIATAAGICLGWVGGGAIGFAVTPKRGPYDDTSGLKGMIIGAPIGAIAGGLIGYRLTK